MSALTDTMETNLINHLFRTATFGKPSALAVALYTAAPGETGGGTEVSGGSYARVSVNPLDANWDATSGGNGATQNTAQITFATPTANWGTIVAVGLFWDSVLGMYGALAQNKTVNNGDPAPYIAAGGLDVTFA